MTDKTAPAPDQVTEVLKFAIGAAGDMTDLHAWRGRLSVLIPEIVATIGEGSRERGQVEKMMSCPVLSGEFRGYTLHDGSHRCIVTFMPDHRDKEETVWSERTDTPHGAAQLRILKALPKGCRVLIWKHTRVISPEKKVRDMLHISRMDADPSETSRPTESSVPPTVPPSPQAESTPGVEDAPGVQTSKIPSPDLHTALEYLTGKQRIAVIKTAKDQGIPNVYSADLTVGQINSLLALCELTRQGMT